MRKLKTLIRNVRKTYREDSALFDPEAEVYPRNPRKQWVPDARTINLTHIIAIHPTSRSPRLPVLAIPGENYFGKNYFD